MKKNYTLLQGDCLEKMKYLPDNSIDLVLTDPPYGTSACKWDSVIPFEPMWYELKRVIKAKSTIGLFCTQPFTSALIMSNPNMFKYCWTWEKNFSTNFLHAKRQPLRKTEDIAIWHPGTSFYYPIKTEGHVPTQSAKGSSKGVLWHGENKRDYSGGDTTRYPTNVIKMDAHDPKNRLHPTQKPVALMEYLIKTYTDEADLVLDFTMGSGTTGVAAMNLNRRFVGIELDENYFNIAEERIYNARLSYLESEVHSHVNAA